MKRIEINGHDISCIVTDDSFYRLGFSELTDEGGHSVRMDVGDALKTLREDRNLAARLLSLPEGTLFWAGSSAGDLHGDRTMGVRIIDRGRRLEKNGNAVVAEGDNVFGEYLSRVREAYQKELSESPVVEEPMWPGQVVSDFVRKDSYVSDIEDDELRGERYIHTEPYTPVKFRHDAGMDGTSGHAQRQSDEDVHFHSFVCPFGTGYRDRIKVESAAEASYLYEQAIRGDLDWNALFDNLYSRGLLDRTFTQRQRESLIAEMRAQFDWMREQISNDTTLRDVPIVTSSLMVPDESMGRSIYDYDRAPSPGHVLARYINNPLLLYEKAENSVIRALAMEDRGESVGFNVKEDGQTVRILVVGSDIIGGRIPGRRGTSKTNLSFDRAEDGSKVIRTEKTYEMPLKSKDEVDADYAAFSARMDSILSGIAPGVNVEFVTGGAGRLSTKIGMGTPRMIERYVRENKGQVMDWNFGRGSAVVDARGGKAENASLSLVRMEHLFECLPVLTGNADKVSFRLDSMEEDSEVEFGRTRTRGGVVDRGFKLDSAVCFSMDGDPGTRDLMMIGSYAASSGLPVVHVMDNQSEEQQKVLLGAGAIISMSSFSGNLEHLEPLFDGDLRTEWDVNSGRGVNIVDMVNGFSVPVVARMCNGSVPVEGISFHTVQGAFVAMMVQELGGSYADVLHVARAEGSHIDLSSMYASLVEGRQGYEQAEEYAMRKAVRQMLGADSEFARLVLETGSDSLIQQSTVGGQRLFTDLDGKGENRFGVVLASERDILRNVRAAQQIRADEERNALLDEASRLHKARTTRRADGEKVREGLPADPAQAAGAVWFVGTAEPLGLSLPDGRTSFMVWDDDGGADRLVREKASRPEVSDGEGGSVDNDYVYIFRSTLEKVYGRKAPYKAADSLDLTGVRRTDPKTGLSFECAFGLPVQYDDMKNESINDLNRKRSYFLDHDAEIFRENLVNTDTKARATALAHDMQLCMPARYQGDGKIVYPMANVFREKIWNKGEWIANPHASKLNETTFRLYAQMLNRGERMPLNIIPMPSGSYAYMTGMGENDGKSMEDARRRFIQELSFSLEIANSLAIAQGVPLRFPLDRDGRIDLGPGVPEEFRQIAEQKIDSFIGVVRQEDVLSGSLPALWRIEGTDALRVSAGGGLQRSEVNLYAKPNDVARAFGLYDFGRISRGNVDTVHRMMFCMEDGTYFEIRDSKTTKGMDDATKEKYMRYTLDDERRFLVYSTDPSKVPAFIPVFKAYMERAKNVGVETRLLASDSADAKDLGTDGLILLQDSNDFGAVALENNQSGRTLDAINSFSRMNEEDGNAVDPSKEYFGKVSAKDIEECYVQVRCTLPDGRQGEWHTVEDQVKVWQLASELTGRRLKDVDEQPEATVRELNLYCVSESIKWNAEEFRNLEVRSEQAKADDKVVSLAGGAAAERKTINVFAGTGENVHLSNFAIRPFGYRTEENAYERFSSVEQCFQYMKSYFADIPEEKREEYRKMVLATTDGARLRKLGNTLQNLDVKAWDAVSDHQMSQMVLFSFLANPDAAKNLVATGDALITHSQDHGRWGTRFPEILMEVRDELKRKMSEDAHMFVTYYGSKTVPENAFKVQISGSRPKDFKVDYEFKETYPDYKSMVERHHKGEIDDQGYTDMYQKILDNRRDRILGRIEEIRQKAAGRDVYFFCYERPGEFCHRYLLNNFLNENGIECRENPADRLRYSKGHVPLFNEDMNDVPFPEVRESRQDGLIDYGIAYSTSTGSYSKRTYENATADGVDFTLSFAVDFDTAGEKCTARAAGDSLVSVDIPLKKDGGIDLSPAAVSRSVNAIVAQLPGDFIDGETMGVNIAGNGIYTLARKGVTQDQCDAYMVKVFSGLEKKGVRITELRSGGQTGIDEAGLVAGKVFGIPATCHSTKDWMYRNADNVDVKGERSFKKRFEDKDYGKLSSLLHRNVEKKEQKKNQGLKM